MCIVKLLSIVNSFLIFLLLMHGINAYFVHYFANQETWTDAQQICNRKGGRLATNEDSIDGLNCSKLKGSPGITTYWTGKYKTISHWIYKIGCYTILEKPYVSTAHSVSKCFDICKKQHIRIKFLAHIRNKCACISENITYQEETANTHRCIDSLNSNNSYWAYKVTKNTQFNGPSKCAFVDCRDVAPTKVYTDSCAIQRTSFCDNKFRSNWKTSQEKCNLTDEIQEDLWNICITLQTNQRTAWLPMHREVFWTEVTCDGIGSDETVTECESFRCSDNGEVPTIPANVNCSDKTDGFFCAFSSPYNMTTERTKTMVNSTALCPRIFKSTNTHGSNESTINVKQTTGKRSFSTIINSSTILQRTTSFIAKRDDNRHIREISEHHATSNIGLIVGGVIGSLAIIGVVILVLILKLRRKNASTKNRNVEQSEISNEDQQRKTPSNNIRVNQLYEDEGACADILVPVRNKESEIANEHDRKKPNDVYAVVMKNNKPPHLQVGLPSVVSSTDVVESEYDRLNITPNFLADNMENNVYDSSIADRCESDPTYNTATNIRHSRTNTDGVYN